MKLKDCSPKSGTNQLKAVSTVKNLQNSNKLQKLYAITQNEHSSLIFHLNMFQKM
jgi:hypothetical protein